MLVDTSATKGLGESPALWSNNPSLLALAQGCFEALWKTAMETPHFSSDEEQG